MSKVVKIKLTDWEHTCADGCCHDYGVELEVNGVKCDNPYAGENVSEAIEFVLKTIGYEVIFE